MTLSVSFKIGTDPETAETAVQNRVTRALPRLPEVVRQLGVTTEKSAPNLTMVVHMVSPDNRYDALYLRNYAALNVRDQLLRIQGMGSVQTFGSGDYAMRIWLDPDKLRGAQPDRQRRGGRGARAERPGRRRRGRGASGAQQHRVPARHQHPGRLATSRSSPT
jgi:hypothetical protein